MLEAAGSARWIQRSNYSSGGAPGASAAERGRTERRPNEPSVALTGRPPQWTSNSASVRITVEEAALLQGFPADYPWQGNKGQRYQQVGNAVPPPLARAILAELIS